MDCLLKIAELVVDNPVVAKQGRRADAVMKGRAAGPDGVCVAKCLL